MKTIRLLKGLLLGIFLLGSAGILIAGGIVERGSGNLVTEEYDLRDFSEIDVSGSWDVTITRGTHRVRVEVDDNILEYVKVERRGETLSLSTKSVRVLNATFKATISMPDLERIETSGSTRVRFSGFESPRLTIKSSGSSRIVGVDCTIGQLDLRSSGSSEKDLRDCVITDAEVDLSGSTRVILTMAGGDLTGKMSGSGSITYYGEVNTLNVKSSGSSRIVKK